MDFLAFNLRAVENRSCYGSNLKLSLIDWRTRRLLELVNPAHI